MCGDRFSSRDVQAQRGLWVSIVWMTILKAGQYASMCAHMTFDPRHGLADAACGVIKMVSIRPLTADKAIMKYDPVAIKGLLPGYSTHLHVLLAYGANMQRV
jgi:hypothetical protein